MGNVNWLDDYDLVAATNLSCFKWWCACGWFWFWVCFNPCKMCKPGNRWNFYSLPAKMCVSKVYFLQHTYLFGAWVISWPFIRHCFFKLILNLRHMQHVCCGNVQCSVDVAVVLFNWDRCVLADWHSLLQASSCRCLDYLQLRIGSNTLHTNMHVWWLQRSIHLIGWYLAL